MHHKKHLTSSVAAGADVAVADNKNKKKNANTAKKCERKLIALTKFS